MRTAKAISKKTGCPAPPPGGLENMEGFSMETVPEPGSSLIPLTVDLGKQVSDMLADGFLLLPHGLSLFHAPAISRRFDTNALE